MSRAHMLSKLLWTEARRVSMPREKDHLRSLQPLAVGVSDLAHLLGVSKSFIYVLDSQGRIPAGFRLGGRRLWTTKEIDAWVSAGAPPREQWKGCPDV